MPRSAMCASVFQTFWPSTTHSSPSRTARVERPARSRAGAGLAEQLTPDFLAGEQRAQEARLQLVACRGRRSWGRRGTFRTRSCRPRRTAHRRRAARWSTRRWSFGRDAEPAEARREPHPGRDRGRTARHGTRRSARGIVVGEESVDQRFDACGVGAGCMAAGRRHGPSVPTPRDTDGDVRYPADARGLRSVRRSARAARRRARAARRPRASDARAHGRRRRRRLRRRRSGRPWSNRAGPASRWRRTGAGSGLGTVEVAVLLEEIGRHVAPAPFRVDGAGPRRARRAPDATSSVERLAGGEAIGCVAWSGRGRGTCTRPGQRRPADRAERPDAVRAVGRASRSWRPETDDGGALFAVDLDDHDRPGASRRWT